MRRNKEQLEREEFLLEGRRTVAKQIIDLYSFIIIKTGVWIGDKVANLVPTVERK